MEEMILWKRDAHVSCKSVTGFVWYLILHQFPVEHCSIPRRTMACTWLKWWLWFCISFSTTCCWLCFFLRLPFLLFPCAFLLISPLPLNPAKRSLDISVRSPSTVSWWCSAWASDSWSKGRYSLVRLWAGRYQVNQVNSAFHPSGVGKSSTVLYGWG